MCREPGPAEFPVVRADSPPSELWSAVQGLLGENGALRAENEKLKARVAELEAKLGRPTRTPENSSLPPSRGQKTNRPADEDTNKRTKASHPGMGRPLSADPDRIFGSQGHGLSALYGRRDGRGPDGAAGLRPHRGAADQAADHAGPPPWGPLSRLPEAVSGAGADRTGAGVAVAQVGGELGHRPALRPCDQLRALVRCVRRDLQGCRSARGRWETFSSALGRRSPTRWPASRPSCCAVPSFAATRPAFA